ncbi:hypothetical protein PYJP_18590 [Pyrofollis japonicus]|uniref:hypothetical protein n=1 Tax=Pyrofollis japonicus TaxID=3060460 RepID=UPI00295C21F0|nr:hypothetical protein [Pyrofollis japonicus]BEP18507.1 hypothetical protein PYJP_18590 [Pyrofollis japonicus]
MLDVAGALLDAYRLSALKGLVKDPRKALAVMYAHKICSNLDGCRAEIALPVTLYTIIAIGKEHIEISDKLPKHIQQHIERALREVEDAAVRAPTSIYAQVALDADALSRIGALSLVLRKIQMQDISTFLGFMAEALSYAYASDYILYTKPARQMIQILKPHTIAYAKWLIEELSLIGITATIKADRTPEGLVAYIDLIQCLNERSFKLATLKPSRNCTRYIVEYECRLLGNKIQYEICVPESTRTR